MKFWPSYSKNTAHSPCSLGNLQLISACQNHQAVQKSLICIYNVWEKQCKVPSGPKLTWPALNTTKKRQETCFQVCNDRLQVFLKLQAFRPSLLMVGNLVCVVILCLICMRCDKVCPQYRVFQTPPSSTKTMWTSRE